MPYWISCIYVIQTAEEEVSPIMLGVRHFMYVAPLICGLEPSYSYIKADHSMSINVPNGILFSGKQIFNGTTIGKHNAGSPENMMILEIAILVWRNKTSLDNC
jgi:hypothetical protein